MTQSAECSYVLLKYYVRTFHSSKMENKLLLKMISEGRRFHKHTYYKKLLKFNFLLCFHQTFHFSPQFLRSVLKIIFKLLLTVWCVCVFSPIAGSTAVLYLSGFRDWGKDSHHTVSRMHLRTFKILYQNFARSCIFLAKERKINSVFFKSYEKIG